MRDLLTGLAIILVVALTTALVAPYLVDWNSQRGFLEARLSHALGQKVTIGGDIDLKLLPTPYLVLDQTVVGGDDASLRIGIRHLDLVLSPTPLLHGEFDIVQAQLREPTLRLTLGTDRSLPTLPAAPAYSADLRFDRIEVSDGTIAIADSQSGRTFVADHLDFVADAPSLSGPFKGSGTGGAAPARTRFRFATTEARDARSRLRLAIDETTTHPSLDLDGTLALARAGETTRPHFEGTAGTSGQLDTGSGSSAPWRLKGQIAADSDRIALSGGELRLGTDEAGVSLDASGLLAFGESVEGKLTLAADQIDIDRLAGPPGTTARPPPHLPDPAALRGLAAAAPFPVDVALDVKGATWAGETLANLAARTRFGVKGAAPSTLSLDAPGHAHVALDGALTGGDPTSFAGTFDISARDVPDALGWLSSVAPDLDLPGDVGFRTMRAQGTLTPRAGGLALERLRLTLDQSALTGTAELTPSAAGRAAKLTARLEAEALDIETLPSVAAIRRSARGLDLDVALEAKALKVSHVGVGTLDAGRLSVALTRSGDRIAVPRFEADNLGGATIRATASLDPRQAMLSARIDAGQLEAASDLLLRLAPGRFAEALHARAPALSPAKLRLEARADVDAKGGLGPRQFDVTGQVAATALDAHLTPGADGTVAFHASADAPEGGALLAQLGLQTLPLDLVGRSRVTLSAQGRPGQPFATTLDGLFGATHVVLDGSFDAFGAPRGGSGTVALKSADLGPILQSAAVAFPDMTGKLPVDLSAGLALAGETVALSDVKGTFAGLDVAGALKWQLNAAGATPALTGALDLDQLSLGALLGLALGPPAPRAADGRLSSEAFTTGLVDPPRAKVRLRAKSFALVAGQVAHDAALDLAVEPNAIGIDDLKAGLGRGSVSGRLMLRRDGPQAALEGRVGLDGVALDLPSVQGRLSGGLDLAGSGASASALVSSLAGTGQATVDGLRVSAADPAALPKLFAEVEDDDVAVDGESVVRAYDAAASAPLEAGRRTVKLALAAGQLRFDPESPPPDGAVASTMTAVLDLRRDALDVTATETLRDVPKEWTGPLPSLAVVWSGPLAAPARHVEAADFLNAVAARALARETARVETYEFDLRERAFFNARLQSEAVREEDRRRAEEDARRAEAARLAARKAAEKAAADKAAAERAAAERAAVDRAARERLSRSSGEAAGHRPEPPSALPFGTAPPPRTAPPPGDAGRFQPAAPGAVDDPSAAGRY